MGNGTLKNSAIAVTLKYISNFCRSLEMPLTNCKMELTVKQTTQCVLSAAGNDNAHKNDHANNIIFTTKDTQLYVPVVTLQQKTIKKLSKLLKKIKI